MDPDTRDLVIHSRIEGALRILGGMYKLARAEGLAALQNRARGHGVENIEHMIEAIIEGLDIAREDLIDRLQAVIELDEEERKERAIRDACEAEAEA